MPLASTEPHLNFYSTGLLGLVWLTVYHGILPFSGFFKHLGVHALFLAGTSIADKIRKWSRGGKLCFIEESVHYHNSRLYLADTQGRRDCIFLVHGCQPDQFLPYNYGVSCRCF